jgi:hypothetical protein
MVKDEGIVIDSAFFLPAGVSMYTILSKDG